MEPLGDDRLEEQLKRFEGYLTSRQIGVLRGLLHAKASGKFRAGVGKENILGPIFEEAHLGAIKDPRRSGDAMALRISRNLEQFYIKNPTERGPAQIRLEGLCPDVKFFSAPSEEVAHGSGGNIHQDSRRWDRLYRLLEEVQRPERAKKGEEDVRLITTFLIDRLQIEEPLKVLLRKGVIIKVIMMNPGNHDLMFARFGIRDDGKTPPVAVQEAVEHIEWLRNLTKEITKEDRLRCPGKVILHLSNIMPTGLMVHTRDSVVFGFMPARGSYVRGPMIEAGCDSALWKMCLSDWKRRWSKRTADTKYGDEIKKRGIVPSWAPKAKKAFRRKQPAGPLPK